MAQGQNRNVPQLVGQMQNPVAVSAPGVVSSQPNDGLRIRHEMLNKIFVWLQQRQPTKTDDASKAKLFEVAKRLENAMIKTATSKEEYLDFQSFEVRIKSILNQMFGRPNNPPSSTGMMVQTPGVSHGWGQTHTATPMVNNSTFNSNNSLADGLPTNRMNGGQVINNGRQQLSANTGQMMMPTPGFNNSTNADVYQSHRNGETSRDGGKLPAVGPEFVSQSQLQRQRPAGSDDRLHYSLDQQLGGGFRSNMHQNASGMSGNSAHLANGHMGSQGVLSSTNFSTSSQPLQQQQPVDQLQQVSHVHRRRIRETTEEMESWKKQRS